jgi:hypothetical protein
MLMTRVELINSADVFRQVLPKQRAQVPRCAIGDKPDFELLKPSRWDDKSS